MSKTPSITTDQLPLHLSQSLTKAIEAFFTPNSHFQLNLDQDISTRIQLDARHCPDPSIFKKAEEAVENMLNASLNQYLSEVSGNAGRYRSRFAVLLGAGVVFAGLVLFFVALALRWSRLVRLVCIPLFFVGTLTYVGGLRRTCIVIFCFGSARQLRAHELDVRLDQAKPRPGLDRRESSNAPSLTTCYIQGTPQVNYQTPEKHTTTEIHFMPPLQPTDSGVSHDGAGQSKISTLDFDSPLKSPALSDLKAIQPVDRQRRPTEASALTYVNPWEALEDEHQRVAASVKSAKSVPVFAPLTRIFSPEIIKKQRDAIVRGFQYGSVVTLLLGAVVMAVPNFP